MKLIVFSDIHGNRAAFDAFLKQAQQIDYDYMIFCGDIFGYYYDQEYIINILKSLPDLIWLKGNHDSYAASAYDGRCEPEYYIKRYGHCYDKIEEKVSPENMEIIKKLPEYAECTMANKKIGIFHGSPQDFLEGRIYPKDMNISREMVDKYDYIFLGHTHFRMMKKIGNTLLLNPGAIGQQRDGKGAGFIVMELEEEQISFMNVDYNKELLYKQIEYFDKNLTKLKTILERKESDL